MLPEDLLLDPSRLAFARCTIPSRNGIQTTRLDGNVSAMSAYKTKGGMQASGAVGDNGQYLLSTRYLPTQSREHQVMLFCPASILRLTKILGCYQAVVLVSVASLLQSAAQSDSTTPLSKELQPIAGATSNPTTSSHFQLPLSVRTTSASKKPSMDSPAQLVPVKRTAATLDSDRSTKVTSKLAQVKREDSDDDYLIIISDENTNPFPHPIQQQHSTRQASTSNKRSRPSVDSGYGEAGASGAGVGQGSNDVESGVRQVIEDSEDEGYQIRAPSLRPPPVVDLVEVERVQCGGRARSTPTAREQSAASERMEVALASRVRAANNHSNDITQVGPFSFLPLAVWTI